MSETTTVRTVQQIRDEFETAAHTGYVSAGLADTDGYYMPEPKSATIADLHRNVPLDARYFRYGNDFKPTQEQLTEYNETFYVGPNYRPDHLDLAVQWRKGWKTYRVTGTRHAAALLRKFAGYNGFQSARLSAPLHREDGYLIDNVIRFDRDDITGSDRFGKFRGLTDPNNAQYDLSPFEQGQRRYEQSRRDAERTRRAEEPEWDEPDPNETPAGYFEK